MDLLLLMTVVPAYLVASFFLKHDPGPEEPQPALHAAVGFGVLSIVLALIFSFLMELVLSGDFLQRVSGVETDSTLPLFADVAIFATIEELVKFVPLAFFIWKKPFFNEITDGIIYFSIVGLTFGAIESFLYGLSGGEFGFAIALMRLGIGLFFHGALTGVAGYYLARAKITKQGFAYVVLALVGVSLIHTLYNYFVYSVQAEPAFIFGAAAMAIGVNAALFWLYYTAMKQDISLGLAGPQFAQQRAQRKAMQQQQAQQNFYAMQQQQAMQQQSVQQMPPATHEPASAPQTSPAPVPNEPPEPPQSHQNPPTPV